MNSKPPPIADPHSTAPQKTKAVAPSASDLTRSGCRLLGIAVLLFLGGNALFPLHEPASTLGVVCIVALCSSLGCFILGCIRLVEASLLFIRSLTS